MIGEREIGGFRFGGEGLDFLELWEKTETCLKC